MTFRVWLRRRWHVDPTLHLPFDTEITRINVGRIELVCLIGLVNSLFEVAQGFGVIAIRLEIPVAIGWIVAVRFLRDAAPTTQRAAVVVFVAMAMLNAHLAVLELAARGAIFSGYPLRLLILTLLFVLSPATLAALILFGLTSQVSMLALLPPELARGRALANTLVVSGIAYVAGWLIHSARRIDHEQRTIIIAQNSRLVAQNAELDQLMAIAAHDLRSPLYGLRHLLDLADRRANADPTLPRRVLREGLDSLDAMLALVTGLLDAHAAEHAPLDVAKGEDLRSVLLAAARRAGPHAAACGVRIEVAMPDQPLLADIDGTALARILDNLLSNAIRYSPANGAVLLSGADHGMVALLKVEDRGSGIAVADRSQLFRKFARVGVPESIESGAGMGLFIAATFAERLGASIRFRPAEPHGAIFEVMIQHPRARGDSQS